MKHLSQFGRSESPVQSRRPAVIRWIRARSAMERALLIKAFFALAVLGIAIYAVSWQVRVMQATMQSIQR